MRHGLDSADQIAQINENLTLLKSQNKLLAVLIIICLILIVGVIFYPRNVMVTGISLVDESGDTRAALGISRDGPALWFYEKNRKLAELGIFGTGARLTMFDSTGKQSIGLWTNPQAAQLSIFDESGKGRIMFGITDNKPEMMVFDRRGRGVWSYDEPGKLSCK